MIELPDVERMIDAFSGYATGKTVSEVLVDDPASLGLDAAELRRSLRGQAIDSIERQGTYVVLRFRSGACLVFHMGSEGELYLESQTAPPAEDSRVRLQFAAGRELRFRAPPGGGEVHLAADSNLSALGLLDTLGLDPLSEELTAERFIELARTKPRSTLKGLLMNQEIVAGIGNEYADEICFQAGLRPDIKIREISDENLVRIHRYLRRVLRRATLHAQAAHSDPGWLIGRRMAGTTCPRCQSTLKAVSVAGRKTYICPRCQRAA